MSNIEEIRQTATALLAELARPDAPLPTFAEARALAEGAIGLVEENAKLRATNGELRGQLTNAIRNNHRRNVELDALHYVWCDGGCPTGMHRFDGKGPSALTAEIVGAAVRNTKRLVRHAVNRGLAIPPEAADPRGVEARLLRSVGATHVADSDRWRWPGEEQAFSCGAAVERALAELRAAFNGAAKAKAQVDALSALVNGTVATMERFSHLKARVVDEKAVQEIAPSAVEAYLASNPKWKRLAPLSLFFVWTHEGSGDHVTIPREQAFADYGRRMLECLETIAQAEERSQLAVLIDLWSLADKQTEPADEPTSNKGDA